MLALATLRTRWRSFVGSFVAVALGVAVLAAALLVFDSARPAVPPRLAAADVVVRGPGANVDDLVRPVVPWTADRAAALTDRLARLPGVSAAVADRSFYAQVVLDGETRDDPPTADPLGHAWSTTALAPYRVVDGRAPRGPGEVALAAAYGVTPGRPVTVLTAAGPTTWTVTATVDGAGIYVADGVADGLAGGVSVIGLVLAPGADTAAVARAAAGELGEAGEDATVLSGTGLAALEPESHVRTRWVGVQVITVTTMLAAFSAVFVMWSTAGLSAYQRRRELALLRAVGATPRQVRRTLLGEAVGVGTVGAVAGAGLGLVLAPILGDLLVRARFEPPGFAVRFAVLPWAAAVGTGILVALLGTWAASRRAARVSPTDALRRAAADPPAASPGRLVLGGLFVAGGLGLAGLTPAVGPDYAITAALGSAMALMVGLALLAAVVIPPLVRLILAPRVVREAPIAVLVRESAVTAVRRTAATVAPVLLTVGFTVLVLGFVTTATPVFGAGGALAAASTVVAAPDGSPGLSDAAVAALPGRVRSVLSTRVFAVGMSGPPVALDALGADPTVLADLGVELGPEAVAVSATGSAGFGWRVGSVLRLVFADGAERSVRVMAVLPDADLPSPVLLRRATVRAHDPSALTMAAYVTGAELSTVDAALAATPGARAMTAAVHRDDDEDRLVWLFVLIVVVVSVGYTGIAVANTVAMATVDRRPALALLRLTGATRAQVMRAVVGETALGVALGATVGFAVALPALFGIRAALQEMTGGPVALVLPWGHTAAAVFACTVFALTAAVTAGRRAVRADASDQVQWAM